MRTKKTYTEEQLVQSLKMKDLAALDYLYDHYSRALYTVIVRIVDAEEVAEDVMQDVFVKLWHSFPMYDESKGRLFTWMASIARNLAIDKIRSKDFRNHQQNQSIDSNVYAIDSQTSSSLNTETLGIKELVETLKPNLKEVVDLVYFKGYTHVEAAETLAIPVGTVKTRLRAAVQELRKYFNLA